MKPEPDESLLNQFHASIVGGAKGEEATRAMPPLSGTIGAPVEYLDLATVIKVSQAVSGEFVQEKQLEILMRTAIEQAGAERGVLVLSRWTEPRIAAQATTGDGGIVVKLHDEAMTPAVLPESVIQHVVRTYESVILDDAAAQNPFSADPYIRQRHARSILCLPFLNGDQLTGVLYLENNLTPGVFAPARIAVLKLLTSQAAISLENARLHRELAEREAKIRRLVETQTPRAEDELRGIVDNAPVFLWSDLPDGRCDFLNQPWLTYFNLSLPEAQGAGWATVLHPDDAAHHLQSWQQSVSTGIPFETEARFRRSDGEYRWFLTRANPLRDKTGRIVKWHGTNIDIENLKRAEARLRQSEAYLAEAQRLSHTGSFGWKPDTGEIIWSAETYRIFDYDRAVTPTIDLVAQRVHPEDRADFQSVIERASGGSSDLEHAYRLLLPDGRVKHVHALAHATQNASGNREFVGAVTDITERKTAEEALRISEAYLAEAQRISHTGSWANAANGEPKYWSEETYRVLGFDPAQPLPSLETIFQRIHPDDRAAMRKQLERGIRDKADFEVDMRFVHPITGVRNIRSICHAVLDRCGDLREMVGTVIDITDRKRAEVLFAGEKRLLEMIATGVALNEILNALCLIIEEHRPGTLASILLLRSDGLYLDSVAGPSLPKTWREEMERLPIGPCAGSCGTAAYRGSPVMVSDIATDPLWEVPEHRAAALSHGLRASWSNPISSSDRKVLGTFCIYGRETRGPSAQDLGLIEKATDLARIAIERDRAEVAVRASEQKYRHLVDTTPAFVHTALPNGEVDFYNRGWLEYVGLPLTDLLGWNWTKSGMIHPEDVETIVPTWRAALEAGEPFIGESRVRRADGEYCWFLQRNVPLRDEAGKIIKWYGTGINITERKCAEEELRLSQRYLAEAQKVSHTGSWAWSPISNAILYWSEECYRILGYDPAQGLPSFESSFERIHPEDRPALAETIERAVREKADFQIEYHLVLPDDTRRNVRILSHPVLDASGKLVEFVGTVMDVTEQKRAEEERRAHLWFLESMDRINRAMQRSNNVELMTSGVMQEALEIFACDRACLIYPCDPDAPTYRTVMEHTSPEYDGALSLGQNLSVTPEWGEAVRRVLHHPGALVDPSVSRGSRERYRVASMLAIAVRPKGDRPYLFAVHSARLRLWTAAEVRLFEETARRLGDALTSVLAHRNLLAREEELRRSQHYLSESQRLSHTASWAWSLVSSTILYWSEECYRIYGFAPAHGLPSFESCVERIHPEDRPAVLETFDKAIREKAELRTEHRVVLPGGVVRNLRILAHPVANASGELTEYLGTVVDVTEQMHAEEEHREHLWFLECMDRVNRAMQRTNDVEGMMSGVLEETLAVFGSDRAWLVYPCDPDSPTVRAVMEHTRPEYPGAFMLGEEFPVDAQAAELLRRALDGPGAVTDLSVSPEIRERFRIQAIIAIAVRPKGDRPYLFGLHQCSHARAWTAAERRLFEEIARRLEDALTSVLAHRNLLAREEELRRSQHYLAEAQRLSHIGSWAFNTAGFGHWSPELFKIHGLEPGGKAPSMPEYLGLVHPEDRDFVAQEIEKMLAGAEGFDFKKRIVRPDGEIRQVRCVGIRATTGGIVQEFIGTGMDVTEQERAEQQLRRSELVRTCAEHALRDAREQLAQASKIASLAELSASIAHEINQPLQAIVANGHASLRWLDATPPNIEKAIHTAKRVVRDGNAAADVVSRIRTLFKHAAPAKVDLDINKLILQVRSLMEGEIQGNGMSLETELGEDVPRIKADAVQIQQVIVNLVRNAIEALAATMERPKPLLIRSRRKADNVVVDVQDHGTGLADLEKIFEPFVTTKQTGMGMGLAICRSIIEAHAGRIWVVRNEVRGVTFSFSLPIEASDAT